MSIEVSIGLAAATGLTGLIGVIKGLIQYYSEKKDKKRIEFKIDDKIIELNSLSHDEYEYIIQSIKKISPERVNINIKDNEKGFLDINAILLIIPGIIALLFAGTFIYLIIANQSVKNYQAPKSLEAAMTTILGYYFGIGASSVATKSKTITLEEYKAIMEKQRTR